VKARPEGRGLVLRAKGLKVDCVESVSRDSRGMELKLFAYKVRGLAERDRGLKAES